jgi:hypothetical protein
MNGFRVLYTLMVPITETLQPALLVKDRTQSAAGIIRLLSIFFYCTGVFALVGGLYAWGKGPIILQPDGMDSPLLWADIIFTTPLSLLAGYGLMKRKKWGLIVAVAAAGAYLYGSFAVYALVALSGPPRPLYLLGPPVFGIALSAVVLYIAIRRKHTL